MIWFKRIYVLKVLSVLLSRLPAMFIDSEIRKICFQREFNLNSF